MSELSGKLRKFRINVSGIKRKAKAVITTQCQYLDCQKIWDDKIYNEFTHTVTCPYCHRKQYDSMGLPVRLDDMDLQSLKQWGMSRDIAADFALGGVHERPSRKSKIMTWEEFEKTYGKQKI